MKILLGKKIGMTRIFDADGKHIAVTAVSVLPMKVTAVKNEEKHGYSAVQVAVAAKKKTNLTEFRVDSLEGYKVNDEVTAELFEIGDDVEVSGTTKGKGFSGAIKRHGFSRGPTTHGSDHHRATGSIGGAYPQRVVKGKKMPGRYGGINATTKNLKIIDIAADKGTVMISGSVPGPNGSVIKIIEKSGISDES